MADNIITAVFGATRETKVRPRYRYDQGQVLMVLGVKNLPDFYEVHFANEGSSADATPLIGTAEGVTIPDSYFQSGATIYAYIYVHDEATDGTTVYKVTIPIINRARPANIEPTPEQEDIIAQAIVALNENVGRSEDAAEQAEASAVRAETAADSAEALTARAEAAAGAAENSATVASSSATTAQEAAQSAEGSSSDAFEYLERALDAANRANSKAASAEQSSNTARGYATQAEAAKQGAETAKTDAQTARTQAQGYRQAAEAAATRAESAATSAGNAQTAAEAAQTAAETAETNAQTYAGQASQSATDAAQSAASAAQTFAQVQTEGQAQIAAIDAEGQRVVESIPEDYSQMEEDVADLKSQIQEIEDGAQSVNLFDKTAAESGVALIYNGTTTSKSNKFTSDYILVETGKKYVYTGSAANPYIAGYDSSEVFVDGSWQTDSQSYTVPEGVKYIRFTDYLQYFDTASFALEKSTLSLQSMSDSVSAMESAENSDVNKYLKAKTVDGGKVIEWEFGVPVTIDDTLSQQGEAADAKAVGDAINGLTNAVTTVENGFFPKVQLDVSTYVEDVMYRITSGVLQTVTQSGYNSVKLPCNPGDVYFVTSYVAQSDRLYLAIFLDSNSALVSAYLQGSASSGHQYTQEKVVIPDGCAYAVFTSYNATAQVFAFDYTKSIVDDDITSLTPSVKCEYLREYNGQMRDSMLGTYAKLITGNLKWTVLGDSITDTWDGHVPAGGGASDAAHGYAKVVARWLQTKYGNGLVFVNNGTGGATTAASIPYVEDYLEGQGFDLIVVALGTNDWNLQTNPTTFKNTYNDLLDEIESRCPGAEIAIVGIGYLADWKPAKTMREDVYNDALYSIAKERGLRFVCPAYEMQNAVFNGKYTFADITYAPDPVHPNDIGHRIWADAAYNLFDIL